MPGINWDTVFAEMDKSADSFFRSLEPQKEWWRIALELPKGAVTINLINGNFRKLSQKRHPDKGGSDQMMEELLNARTEALKHVQPPRAPR